MSENNYTPLQSEQKILEKFMKILKFYNEIIKSSPLIVSDKSYLDYKKQKLIYKRQIDEIEKSFTRPTIDFAAEVGDDTPQYMSLTIETLDTHKLEDDEEEHRYKLNIPEDKKTRFNVYILKKINDLENDLDEFLSTLDYFYLKYKRYYNYFSLYNIAASTSMTLVESISLMFKPQVYTGVVTIIMSTSIALSTAVLKLKNYKEKIEDIVKTTEKVYSCQAQLFTFDKHLKTSLNMSKELNPDEY